MRAYESFHGIKSPWHRAPFARYEQWRTPTRTGFYFLVLALVLTIIRFGVVRREATDAGLEMPLEDIAGWSQVFLLGFMASGACFLSRFTPRRRLSRLRGRCLNCGGIRLSEFVDRCSTCGSDLRRQDEYAAWVARWTGRQERRQPPERAERPFLVH